MHDIGEQLAEGFGSQCRKLAEALVSAHKNCGQMTDEAAALDGKGTLRELDELQQAVEAVTILHDHAHHGSGSAVALVLDKARADFAGDARQINAGRTDVLARFAAYAVLHQVTCLVCTVIEVGQGKADGTDVHVAHLVAADKAVDGADVGAGATAHAAQDLAEEGILGDLGTAVVKEDNVHFLASVRSGGAFVGTGYPGDVGSDGLGRSVPGQDLDAAQGFVNGGDEFFESGNNDMDPGQRGHETQVALVGTGSHHAGFGNGEVGAGDAHVGIDVFRTQFAAGDLDKLLDVRTLLDLCHVGEQVGHLVPGKMDGRHDHVGRAFMAELDDPFAKVCLHHAEAVLFQGGVQVDFLSRHRLGLDNVLAVVVTGDFADDAVGILCSFGQMDVHAALFRLCLELLVQLGHVLGGIILDFGYFVDKSLDINAFKDAGTAGLVFHGELVKSLAQELVVQRFLNLAVIFFHSLVFGHVLPLQKDNMKFKRTMHAEGSDTFDISGTAGAGNVGGIGCTATGQQVTQKGGGIFQFVQQCGLAHQDDGDFGNHGAEPHFFVVGVDDTGNGIGNQSVSPGNTGVKAAKVIAKACTQQVDA